MTPGARIQAAIELLDDIIAAARTGGAAADTLVARYFATRRYAGSKDRRAVRALVYAAVRRAGEVPASGRAAMLGLADEDATVAAEFDGSPHGPAPITADEPCAPAGIAPAWLEAVLDRSQVPRAGWPALVARAPLDLRVNTLRVTVAEARAALPDAEPVPGVPDALRLPTGSAIERHPLFLDGGVEVQDAGSQMIAFAAGAEPGMTVVDLCAGAGGKTLALAAAMGGLGQGGGALIACDIDRARLSRLAPRAARAGAEGIVTRLLDPGRELEALADLVGQADVVLVDAPCSGTGTWRRNPEARWRLTPDRLARLVASQAHVLRVARALVRPGGSLVYAVCSVLDDEGAQQVAPLIAEGWLPEPLPVGTPRGAGVRLIPAEHGTDGFFLARLRRPC
ncbi:RsmB/NOP family class I SAM-dependent RNA methyltransferase [uncultured Sphingomonas sp.]|uniref:RsmB/NOP family class I SAM-dependent RNA methyltransferase n=1 Tax=uncultured Sphingomonas sp. TaxID=158754 RepID=UPI0035CC5526